MLPIELFDLVHSLDSAEQRAFQLQGKLQAGDKTYMEVYEQLSNTNTCDIALDASLRKLFTTDSAYAERKNYLQSAILKSLRFNGRATQSQQALVYFHLVELLYERMQFDLLNKVLKKAEKYLWENESFELLNRVLHYKRLYYSKFRSTEYLKISEQILADMQKALSCQQNHLDYLCLYSALLNFSRKNISLKQAKEFKTLEDFKKHRLLINPDKAICKNSLLLFHSCWFMIGTVERDAAVMGKSVDGLKQIAFSFKEPKQKKRFIYLYYMCAASFYQIKADWDKLKEVLLELNKLHNGIPAYEYAGKINTFYVEYYYANFIDSEDAVKKYINDTLDFRKRFEKVIPNFRKQNLDLFLCFSYAKLGDFEMAYNYNMELQSLNRSKFRKDYRIAGKMVWLLILVELNKEPMFIRRAATKVYNYLGRELDKYPHVVKWVWAFKKLPNDYTDTVVFTNHFSPLLTYLKAENFAYMSKNFYTGYFDFIGWLERRIGV